MVAMLWTQRASVVSQKQGDMIVDENLVNGTSEAKGFIGG